MMRLSIIEKGIGLIQGGLRDLSRKTERAVANATGQLAHSLRREIVTGIRAQAPGGLQFKPLAESTKARKGSSKALIDHGDLIRSINVTKMSDLVYFVGVHRMYAVRIGRSALSLVNIAEIHEFGSKKRPGRPPARPFLIPSYKVWRYGAEKEFAELVGKQLGLPAFAGVRGGVGAKMGSISFGDGGEV
ncbi:MAG: phage virion morphogenesis protein [Thermotogota bacterium]